MKQYINIAYSTIVMVMAKLNRTSIEVDKATRDKLADIGRKNESYNEIINRLLASSKSSTRKNREEVAV